MPHPRRTRAAPGRILPGDAGRRQGDGLLTPAVAPRPRLRLVPVCASSPPAPYPRLRPTIATPSADSAMPAQPSGGIASPSIGQAASADIDGTR